MSEIVKTFDKGLEREFIEYHLYMMRKELEDYTGKASHIYTTETHTDSNVILKAFTN
jgi:hypothetical protein